MRRSAGLVVALLALALLVNFSTARMVDIDLLLPSQEHVGHKKPWACCDMCLCTRSIPPQCRCTDKMIGGCHPNCEKCMCTKSIPPICYCRDIIKEDCGDPCNP